MITTNILTPTNVIDIRRSANSGMTTTELANKYGVSQRTIQRVISGESWTSVPSNVTLSHINSNYQLTADGRIWSNAKNGYITVESNKARLQTSKGKKITVNVTELVSEYFN